MNDDPTPSEAIVALEARGYVRLVNFGPMEERMPLDEDVRLVGIAVQGLDSLVGERVRVIFGDDGAPIRIETAAGY